MHQIRMDDTVDDPSEVLRMARMAVKEANNRALRMQTQTTQQLVQRVKDLKYWSGEIDRELSDLKEDNEDIQRYFRKLQTCVDITMMPSNATKPVLLCGERELMWTAMTEWMLHCTKKKRLLQILEINDDSKNKLVRDYTLKQEAVSLDHKAAAFGIEHRFTKRTPSGELELRETMPMQRMSEYQEWVENTAFNLNHSAKSRTRSRKIVQRLINSTRDMAQLMRQEAISVDNTLKDSIKNWTEWRDAVQAQLAAKEKEMKVADAAIHEIQFSLKVNGSPLQVALMRQTQRGMRPGIELCNDKAQHALQAELNNLKNSMVSLEVSMGKYFCWAHKF
uniref:Tektin n=1 Tax=Ditylenchus dipsaci TaxID=166011 RepID=A0A915DUK9_9BILA